VGQFVFDLQFFIQIATIGNYSSRKMRQAVSAMIARAKRAANLNPDEGRYLLVFVVELFKLDASTNIGPVGFFCTSSVLHGNDLFEESARKAFFKLQADIDDSKA
jgi:hypothetical protein